MRAHTHGLVLLRSDTGNGGWSLHTREQIAEAERYEESPDYIMCGTAEWDQALGEWSAPDQDDYDQAAVCAAKFVNGTLAA